MFSAEHLLNPVSAAQPGGDDLSFSPELDAIAQARKFDDPSLEQGEWVTDLKEADWAFVVQRCAALLEQRSKDLRLAVWLTEAAAKQYHLRGLAEGYLVLAGLFEKFWDQGLYPEADDDQEQRIGNLGWILARTPALLRDMPLTGGHGRSYSSVDFDAARKQANNGNAPPGQPKLAELEAARRDSSSQFLDAFAADAADCMAALRQLEQAADARLGQDSPGFSAAREALQAMLRMVPARVVENAAPEQAPGLPAADGAAQAPLPAGPRGVPQSRTQAIEQLRSVAQFFRRTEPHSPVSYFADKAANAAEQDLHSWLRSVVKDHASMAHIEELLGVKAPPAE
ncbi:MAG: type VI secretion system protein TssA [Pseudomonadota bacterium]